jgi:DNA-directed RNA polymerase specialized sigma24 family protein
MEVISPMAAIEDPRFDTWYRDSYPRVWAALLGEVRNASEAREATDEAFLRAWERWDQVCTLVDPLPRRGEQATERLSHGACCAPE